MRRNMPVLKVNTAFVAKVSRPATLQTKYPSMRKSKSMPHSIVHKARPQDIVDSQSHTFKTKVFKHPQTCAVCKEIIWNEGRNCRVCKFSCHKKCEFKVVTACAPPVNYPLPSNEGVKTTHSILKSPSSSSDSTTSMSTATANSAPVAVHTSGGDIALKGRNGDGLARYSFDLEVDYITERIIAVSFPAGGLEAQYKSNLRDVVDMLKTKHQSSYIVFNLSRRRQDIAKLNNQVYDLGWPNQLAPPLERLCSICKHIETWLKSDPDHVVVLHCKGGRGPIGTVISAYMNYINITSSAETMLDRYAMKRFLDAKVMPIMHPSQHRYVGYFMGLLQGSININSAPLYLHNILIHGVPNFDSAGGCRPFVRIYQGMQPVYTSGVYSIPEGTSRFAIALDQALPLRGDILVKCYHKKSRATTRDVIFRCQFHTTAVAENRVEFKKDELDDASTDARFADYSKVELIFSVSPDKVHDSDYVPEDSRFPVDNTDDPMTRWDSYENFNKLVEEEQNMPKLVPASEKNPQDIPHSSAPDGSLYAQVKKSPSPENNPGKPLATSTPMRMANGSAMQNGPARQMNHKEKTELEALLKGIEEDSPDGDSKGSVEEENKFVSNNQVRATTNGGNLQTTPSFAPKPGGGTQPPSLSARNPRSDRENPYAEITTVRKQEQQMVESGQSPRGPVQEEVLTMRQVKIEESSAPMFNGMNGTSMQNSADRTPNGYVNHSTQYSPQVTPQTKRTIEPKAQSMPNSPTRFAPQVNGGPQSPPPNVYQPQPVRAKKEQIKYITRITPPGTPIMDRKGFGFEDHVQPQQRDVDMQAPVQPYRRGSAPNTSTVPDDSMSWLQKQQQKLREKKAKETRGRPAGDLVRPTPWREPQPEIKTTENIHTYAARHNSPVMEPKRLYSATEPQTYAAKEPQTYARREPQTYALREPQTYAAKEPQTYRTREVHTYRQQTYTSQDPQTFDKVEPRYAAKEMFNQYEQPASQPAENLSWLEIQQQKLKERQDGIQKPLYVDTSHHTTPSQISPLRSDSGLSSPASQYKPSSEISPGNSTSSSIRYGRPASPALRHIEDLEDSISELESLRNTPRAHAPTPPNTYVNYQTTTETRSWQSHQRPLNRQTSDITHNKRPFEDYHTPSVSAGLPPPSPRKDRPGSPGPLSASTPTTPTQGMDDIDLHIEEPLNLDGLVKGRVHNMTTRIAEHERSMSPPPPPSRGRPQRRAHGQTGYDSDTAVQQYYTSPTRRLRDPSPPDEWMRNPGALPAKENEYWNRAQGLKSPEMERQERRQQNYDIGSSNESLHSISSSASGARTPKFPMAPKLKSMVSTPITFVGKPPHGPDAPPVLKSVHKNDLDGPLSDLYIQDDVPQQQRTVTTQRTVQYTETKTTRQQTEQYPMEDQVDSREPARPQYQVENREPARPQYQVDSREQARPQYQVDNREPARPQYQVDNREPARPQYQVDNREPARPQYQVDNREPARPQYQDSREPARPQYPIEANVEVKPVSYQTTQKTIETRLETMPGGQDVIQPQVSQRLETPPAKPPHSTIQFGTAPVEFRGGVPTWPTGPLAVEGHVPNEQAHVDETMVSPQNQIQEEMVMPTVVRKEESAPMSWDFMEKKPGPAEKTSPKYTTSTSEPLEFVMPPMTNGTVQTPSPEHRPMQVVEEPSISVQRVKVEESAPLQQQMQQLEEAPISEQKSKTEENEPLKLQTQGLQPGPSVPSATSPQTPSFTDNLDKPMGPPGVMYPTFSDRHRKAGPMKVDDTPPGYKTLYDNKKGSRASTGSNEGVWPTPGSPARGMSNGSVTPSASGRTTPSNFYHMQQHSPFGSNLSLVDPGVEKVRFVKDLSAWWYKPHATRDEAIVMLRDKSAGSFVVRDSNSFPGAFGLAVKVSQLPPNAPPSKKGGDPANELVRHFLIEPNARGVRLKGCVNEPIFGSLSALIYQHTLTQLALPCKLALPDIDPAGSPDSPDGVMDSKSITALLTQGAACNVLYLNSFEMESLTGPNAVREAMDRLQESPRRPKAIVVHFKVALKGITITDSHRKLFFRRHYPVDSVLFCGMEPASRRWTRVPGQEEPDAKIYGFVARKPGSLTDNMCHLFAEYEREQPASAIVSFVTKVLLGSAKKITPKTP